MSTLDKLLVKHDHKMTPDDFRAACDNPTMTQPTMPSFDLFGHLLEKYGPTMTPSDVGEVLHRHPSHIRALCQSGVLPAVRIGERWHISTAKLAQIIEGSEQL